MITEHTNYTPLDTCVCIGESLAASLPERLGLVEVPLLSSADLALHVGRHAGWDQRRAFELGLIRGAARRSGQEDLVVACTAGIDRIRARRAAGAPDDAP